jgi:mannose-6-phosphate isomerase-like protein (cupin superfamily)
MKSQITTLDPVTTSPNTRTVLAKEGYTTSILTLAPGDETPPLAPTDINEHLVFVLEGEATVRTGEVNTVLGKEQALLIRKGEDHVISAHPRGVTRILRIDVPPRQIVTPPIITLER